MFNKLKSFLDLLKSNNKKCYNTQNKSVTEKRGVIMVNNVSAIDLSKFIIHYYNNCQKDISNLKLQKILYYIQGYYLKRYNKVAFDAKIHNWPYGPVIKDVYYEYNIYGSKNIVLNDEIENLEIKLRSSLKDLVLKILSKCSDISALQLANKTHSETPWANTHIGQEIPNDLIYDYFSKNNPLDLEVS